MEKAKTGDIIKVRTEFYSEILCKVSQMLPETYNEYVICKTSNGEKVLCKYEKEGYRVLSLYEIAMSLHSISYSNIPDAIDCSPCEG